MLSNTTFHRLGLMTRETCMIKVINLCEVREVCSALDSVMTWDPYDHILKLSWQVGNFWQRFKLSSGTLMIISGNFGLNVIVVG